jgi:hypothetical protein
MGSTSNWHMQLFVVLLTGRGSPCKPHPVLHPWSSSTSVSCNQGLFAALHAPACNTKCKITSLQDQH